MSELGYIIYLNKIMLELKEFEKIPHKKIKPNEMPRPLEFTILATHNFARYLLNSTPKGLQ